MYTYFLLSLVATAWAAPPIHQRALLAPSATIKNGTVVGSSNGIIDTFNGIPFAEPPTGTLRLKPPHSITSTFGTITATGIPTACPQFGSTDNFQDLPDGVLGQVLDLPIVQTASVAGEDCLTLNIQRPAGTTSSSKLPVLFWIYGGGFETGSTQTYDGTELIAKSVALGQPVLFVAVNYRLGGFGFLAGKELQADGSTNLGLRDQRLGLEWVADNIAAFGGDTTKLTLWGESAGSISVLDQMVINGGNNKYNGKPLFRAAIMDSGSTVPAVPVSDPKAQNVYDTVVNAAGCSSASDTLACLRALPYATFLNAVNSVPGIFSYSSVDLSYVPRPDPKSSFFSLSPEECIGNGDYTHVPLIIGDQEDEGTLFSLVQSNLTTNADVINYLASYFPYARPADVAEYVNTYPDTPAAGSPFNTSSANELYPEFKRVAAILGDAVFTLTRRGFLANVSSEVNAWSYLSSYDYGTPILGTFHASDLVLLYFNPTTAVNPVATNSILTYYIEFVNSMAPNGALAAAAGLQTWPQYEPTGRQIMNFRTEADVVIKDDFREVSYQALRKYTGEFRV